MQQTERAAAEALVKKRDMEAAAAAVIEAERRATESRAAEVHLLGKIRYVQVVFIACLGWCYFNVDAHSRFFPLCLFMSFYLCLLTLGSCNGASFSRGTHRGTTSTGG